MGGKVHHVLWVLVMTPAFGPREPGAMGGGRCRRDVMLAILTDRLGEDGVWGWGLRAEAGSPARGLLEHKGKGLGSSGGGKWWNWRYLHLVLTGCAEGPV